jgi:citrate lyase beta subunit
MNRSLPPESLQDLTEQLSIAHAAFQSRYPGATGKRQPVHSVYGGAHLFRANTAQRFGELAFRALDEYAPDFVAFARAVSLPGNERLPDSPELAAALVKSVEANPQGARKENRPAWFAHTVYRRVREKLEHEPVEDYRIDFEDGYGNRSDDEEDGHAIAAANEAANAMMLGQLPPFFGIRIKPLSEELRERSIRTLDIFATELATKTNGKLPANFCITLPKVTLTEEVAAIADLCSRLEFALQLDPGTFRIELMIETPQAIFNQRGEVNLLPLVAAADGRCTAAHFGPYDYTASRGITASHQRLDHFACDFAREAMQVALAGTGVWLSDGPTHILPIPAHRPGKDGAPFSARQLEENRHAIHFAWKLHFQNIRRALVNGFYQGWDLHPAQLPARYAAVFSFFLEGLDAAAERLRNFIEKAAQATLVGGVFDDAATGQGLLNYFVRAINCRAVTPEEAQALTGVSLEELRTASFLKILENRRA